MAFCRSFSFALSQTLKLCMLATAVLECCHKGLAIEFALKGFDCVLEQLLGVMAR